ncbi:hypothetical protein H1Q63_12365 [Desmonostoc muscorum CCALA 125]|nr:hypothetical protein [Desmonostoc muscorum CCALA 125]
MALSNLQNCIWALGMGHGALGNTVENDQQNPHVETRFIASFGQMTNDTLVISLN